MAAVINQESQQQRVKTTTHIFLRKVSESEVRPGQKKPPSQKLLVVSALFPQRRLKEVWIRNRCKEQLNCFTCKKKKKRHIV